MSLVYTAEAIVRMVRNLCNKRQSAATIKWVGLEYKTILDEIKQNGYLVHSIAGRAGCHFKCLCNGEHKEEIRECVVRFRV